jgi:tungstate transport system ATP-binding protein
MVETILPLKVENAHISKRGKTIIGPVTFDITKQGFTTIIGPNGSGKTTLLKMMHGLERPKEGTLNWNCDLELARLHQAYVFQTPILLRRSVIENMIYPLRLKGMKHQQTFAKAKEWLEQINLLEASDLSAKILSGGEKQKLAIARALATNPEVVFLDEPTTNLDGTSTREIETLLKKAIQTKTKIIMTTHDMGQAKRLSDEVMFVYRGKIHEFSAASSFFNKPDSVEARAFLEGDILE